MLSVMIFENGLYSPEIQLQVKKPLDAAVDLSNKAIEA